ncbi:MAG TPA: alpha-ketoglutarate-dependent dioxygenase AlkB [Polynucleobacter sp.]|jgi:alkylated DNA repair dioxygenase AlkB|nr:alpha-ketoglutarate-dependent dioxygenase AlkB [Polynucleobacter sp.]HQS61224.1 alpha-ketoglutarate-dependent dioxygenase AlkB [Polynucleobacter sp.]HQT20493.1 alpha-ketoglutarate-dependent dioxygenase AlkB [Polynucleobacter sp.]HQT41202.1 alpha-ketoglutarate-dependent dioxygenase AlkB [Polynucleobacter sp.]
MKMQIPLFEPDNTQAPPNLLRKDGYAQYFAKVFSSANCETLLNTLLQTLDWQPDHLTMFGKQVITKRKVVWIGDKGCSYTYSGQKKDPQSWTPELLIIKEQLEDLAAWKFNSCLLNLYHDGNEAMGWHSDNEAELNPLAPIASLSLGGERKFAFRHREDKESNSILLENGSVLIMHSPTQEFWQHSLLKTTLPVRPRMNLTFRDIL